MICVELAAGRFVNPTYKNFIDEFYKVKNNPTQEARQVIKKLTDKKSF
jgi:hypothetical protein